VAKNSIEAYGASGKSNVLFFDPDALTLVTDPAHPLYDERVNLPVSEEMVLNIMYQGVVQAITIAKNPETGDVEVAAGRQRVKAAREANRRLRERGDKPILVPALPRRATAKALAGVMVSENELRTADTPMGRARKMRQLLEQGYQEPDLVVLFGCSGETVRNTLALLDCTETVQQAVEGGKVTATHARQLAKLEPQAQREKAAELIAAGEGVKPHERARRQREVLASSKPRTRGRREIEARLAVANGLYADALRWVLGLDGEAPAAGEQQETA